MTPQCYFKHEISQMEYCDTELQLDSWDWDAPVAHLEGRVESAPPRPSPEYVEVPQFPPRLRIGCDDSSTGIVRRRGTVRWQASGFFLTYSQSSLSRDVLIQGLARQQTVKRVIVGQEHHQDGNLHWHVLIEYESRKDIRNEKHFDLQGEHPNVATYHRNGEQTYEQWFYHHWNYCKKEDPTPFIVGEEPKENRKRKRNELFSHAIGLAKGSSVADAMDFLEDFAPYDLLTKYEQIHRALVRLRTTATQMQTPARSLWEFKNVPLIPELWHCLYINGPTGLGKTAWARALLPEATVVSHRNQLVDCDFSKGVIFDDFDVGHWPPTAVIHLCDWDEPRGLDVKHGHVVIPCHTQKIFTHNRDFERWVSKDATDEQIAATRRRLFVVNIHKSMF